MPLTTMPAKYWACPRCGTRNERRFVRCNHYERVAFGKEVRCEGRRRKTRRPKHEEVLRGDTYPLFVQAARDIHGVTDESCCACGKPRTQERHHDRDHDHRTGNPRGLLCPGNRGCNVLLVPWITAATAKGIATAKLAAGEPDALRWTLLAGYLERVEEFYR